MKLMLIKLMMIFSSIILIMDNPMSMSSIVC